MTYKVEILATPAELVLSCSTLEQLLPFTHNGKLFDTHRCCPRQEGDYSCAKELIASVADAHDRTEARVATFSFASTRQLTRGKSSVVVAP